MAWFNLVNSTEDLGGPKSAKNLRMILKSRGARSSTSSTNNKNSSNSNKTRTAKSGNNGSTRTNSGNSNATAAVSSTTIADFKALYHTYYKTAGKNIQNMTDEQLDKLLDMTALNSLIYNSETENLVRDLTKEKTRRIQKSQRAEEEAAKKLAEEEAAKKLAEEEAIKQKKEGKKNNEGETPVTEVPATEVPATEPISTKHWYQNHWIPFNEYWWNPKKPGFWVLNGTSWGLRALNAGVNMATADENNKWGFDDFVFNTRKGWFPFQYISTPGVVIGLGQLGKSLIDNTDWQHFWYNAGNMNTFEQKPTAWIVTSATNPEVQWVETSDGKTMPLAEFEAEKSKYNLVDGPPTSSNLK